MLRGRESDMLSKNQACMLVLKGELIDFLHASNKRITLDYHAHVYFVEK